MLMLMVIVFLVLLRVLPANAGRFSAEAVHIQNGKETAKEAVLVAGKMIRIEDPNRKNAPIIILRPDLEMVFKLDPENQTFDEHPYFVGAHWTNRHAALKGSLSLKGQEVVAGQVCERYEILGANFAVWISKEHDFPIRTTMAGKTVELRNIRNQEVDDGLFAPPAGYTLGYSIFALQTGSPRFSPSAKKPAVPKTTGPPVKTGQPREKAVSTRTGEPLRTLPVPAGPLPDSRLRILTYPGDKGVVSLEQPLVVRFSRPVLSDFFIFSVKPSIGDWRTEWDKDARAATLRHAAPFADNQTYTLTISFLGEPDMVASFTAKGPEPSDLIRRHLERQVITIDQATQYRIYQIFAPSKVPQPYRLKKPIQSGTRNMLEAMQAFDDLEAETQKELAPYILPPHHPESIHHRHFYPYGGRRPQGNFPSLTAEAWADTGDIIEAVHHTATGYKVVVMGHRSLAPRVRKARDLIRDKRMYEQFEELMGRKTLDNGDQTLYIYLRLLFEGEEWAEEQPLGLCWSDTELPGTAKEDKYKRPGMILIFADQCETDRELGYSLAHEIFHAFQFAFTIKADNWLLEGSAVWAEDKIDKTWNHEQEFLGDTFNILENTLVALTDESSVDIPYAMYLFPYYLTELSPGNEDIIRNIWEAHQSTKDSVEATKAALPDFDAHWKTYALAAIDEKPEQGRFRDVAKPPGDDPLQLNYRHAFNSFEIGEDGYGSTTFTLTHLGAAYIKAENYSIGPDAPAVSFDLRPFHGNNKITVQAIISYWDGRREYEDWSDIPERIFCLSHDDQNFEEIYLVVANAAEEKNWPEENQGQTMEVSQAWDNDCYLGSVTMTLRTMGSESKEMRTRSRDLKSSTTSTSSWSRSTTVRMKFKPWRQEMPARLSSHLKQLPTLYPEVQKKEPELIEKAKREVTKAVKAHIPPGPQIIDPHTGCTILKYRVTSCSIISGSGDKRLKSKSDRHDTVGMIKKCTMDNSEHARTTGLSENTQESLAAKEMEVDVFIDPATNKIKWVQIDPPNVEMSVRRHSKHPCTKRYQDRYSGDHYYKDEDFSWSDTIDQRITVTFDSDSEARRGQPMDPVWKAKKSAKTSASGNARKERPLDHQWNTGEDQGKITGKEVTEFSWRLRLEPVDQSR